MNTFLINEDQLMLILDLIDIAIMTKQSEIENEEMNTSMLSGLQVEISQKEIQAMEGDMRELYKLKNELRGLNKQ